MVGVQLGAKVTGRVKNEGISYFCFLHRTAGMTLPSSRSLHLHALSAQGERATVLVELQARKEGTNDFRSDTTWCMGPVGQL